MVGKRWVAGLAVTGYAAGQPRDELKRLTDALGRPELARVSVSDPPTGLPPWIEGNSDPSWREELNAVELRYWISFGGVEFDTPQLAVVLDEDGQRRICGHATDATPRLLAMLDDGIRDVGLPPFGALSELMPAGVGDGYQQAQDGPYPPEVMPGALEGYARAWQQVGASGGVRVDAFRFGSPEVAQAWAVNEARLRAFSAVQQFDVPGLPGAVGVRLSAVDYLLIQPAGEPPFSDWVYFVAGDVGVQVAVNQDEPDGGTRVAADIALQVAGLAG